MSSKKSKKSFFDKYKEYAPHYFDRTPESLSNSDASLKHSGTYLKQANYESSPDENTENRLAGYVPIVTLIANLVLLIGKISYYLLNKTFLIDILIFPAYFLLFIGFISYLRFFQFLRGPTEFNDGLGNPDNYYSQTISYLLKSATFWIKVQMFISVITFCGILIVRLFKFKKREKYKKMIMNTIIIFHSFVLLINIIFVFFLITNRESVFENYQSMNTSYNTLSQNSKTLSYITS